MARSLHGVIQGCEFEDLILDAFRNKTWKTYNIMDERNIINQHGKNVTGIDFIINEKGKTVFIQAKREKTSGSVRDIHHFILCCMMIVYDRKIEDYAMIWCCKNLPSKPSQLTIERYGVIVLCDDDMNKQITDLKGIVDDFFAKRTIKKREKKITESIGYLRRIWNYFSSFIVYD